MNKIIALIYKYKRAILSLSPFICFDFQVSKILNFWSYHRITAWISYYMSAITNPRGILQRITCWCARDASVLLWTRYTSLRLWRECLGSAKTLIPRYPQELDDVAICVADEWPLLLTLYIYANGFAERIELAMIYREIHLLRLYCNRHCPPLRPREGGPTSTRVAGGRGGEGRKTWCLLEWEYSVRNIRRWSRETGGWKGIVEHDYTTAKSTSRNEVASPGSQ